MPHPGIVGRWELRRTEMDQVAIDDPSTQCADPAVYPRAFVARGWLSLMVLAAAVTLADPSYGATFVVTSTTDRPDVRDDRMCRTETGSCSLRAAIEESN